MKILEELWYGRINPSQRMQPEDKSDSELTEQIVEKEDELDSLLSDKAKEILEQVRDKQLDLSTSNERKAFISGFRVGARIMLETMDDFYAKDISKKVRAGIRQKQKTIGLVLSLPFGYYLDRNTNKVEIDSETAEYVREVFRLYVVLFDTMHKIYYAMLSIHFFTILIII